jgi:hypothetical protein
VVDAADGEDAASSGCVAPSTASIQAQAGHIWMRLGVYRGGLAGRGGAYHGGCVCHHLVCDGRDSMVVSLGLASC